MDHLQESDAASDYAQRMVQRLSMDVSEVKGDLERTNKFLAIVRQTTACTVKRLDEQMQDVVSVMKGIEDAMGALRSDARGDKSRQEDVAKQVSTNASTLEDLQAKVERLAGETHVVKGDLLSNEARLEVWQKELRELRRWQLGFAPKLEDKVGRPPPSSQGRGPAAEQAAWPVKKNFAASVEPIGTAGVTVSANVTGRMGSGSGTGLRLQQDREHADFGIVPPRGASRAAVWEQPEVDEVLANSGSLSTTVAMEEASAGSRLPLLGSSMRQSTGSRGGTEPGPRLRFAATMAKPESCGTPG